MKVEILCPLYNAEIYVEELNKNINKQKNVDFEVRYLLTESSDNTKKILDKNHLKYDLIKKEDFSHSLTRENAAKKSNADIIISGVEKWWEKTNFTELLKIPYQGKYKMKELLPKFAMVQKNTGIYGYCWGKLLKKELIEEVYFTNGLKLAEDFDFYLQIYPKVDTIFFENNCHYFYLQEAQNSSMLSADNEIDYKAQLKINLRYRDFLKKMNSYNEYNRLLVDRILTNYVFFVVYHARRQEISKKVEEMNQIAYQENINLKGVGTIQNIILWCIKNKKGILAEKLLRIYDILRWFKRKSRLFL